MKILLLKDVKGLGKAGDVVNASEGYVRNMLVPQKIAVIADNAVMADVKKRNDIIDAKNAKNKQAAIDLREKITKEKVVIPAKVGAGGKLFGAITNTEIANSINSKYNTSIDKKKINIKEPIKHVGSFSAEIKLYNGVVASVAIEVSAKE